MRFHCAAKLGEPPSKSLTSTLAREGVAAAHALASGDMMAMEPLGTMTKKDDGSMEIEVASAMITRENAESMFCEGFGDDLECK
jgi:ribose transport system substrate-binding protein